VRVASLLPSATEALFALASTHRRLAQL